MFSGFRSKTIVFSLFALFCGNVYSHSSISYSYPKVAKDKSKCLSAGEYALKKSGYNIYNRSSEQIGAKRGEFRTLVVCARADMGVGFIITTGDQSDPTNEVKIVHSYFIKKAK